MRKKFDVADREVLVSRERHKMIDVHRVLATIPLQTYHVIADIGCGPGFFTVPLAKFVFDGKVFAVDVQQEMLDSLKEAVDKVKLTNVEYVLSKESRLQLENDSLDGAVLAFVLQEARNSEALLEETKRCLHKGGWLAILEWHKLETPQGPPTEQRIAEADMREMVSKAGLRFVSRVELNRDQYMIVARK